MSNYTEEELKRLAKAISGRVAWEVFKMLLPYWVGATIGLYIAIHYIL